MSDQREPGGLKIPGVEIHLPATWTGCISLCIIVIAIAATVVTVVMFGRPENIQAVGSVIGGVQALIYDESGLSKTEFRRQFQFMTPIDNPDERDEKANAFGDELVKIGFTKGWRRYKYEGQGKTRDTGWWWTLTVDDSFNVSQFVKFYRDYWHLPDIYLEKLDTYGNVLPSGQIPTPILERK